ncbi:hypothetical protein U91I_01103 [alpha proteobacterium U9-1i]|nr:hypothetical protein U91I_01103 [alpha proteobacterium U9-1i]
MANGAETDAPTATASGLPRFVSLKATNANGRQGPGVEHRIDWIYARPGLPMLLTAEDGPWRRVRDPDGAEVWMHADNLDARRTVFVPDGQAVALRRNPQSGATALAMLAPGVVGALTGCHGDWRRVSIGGRVGWVGKDDVWAAQDCAGV